MMSPDEGEQLHQKTISSTDITVRLALPVRLMPHVWPINETHVGSVREFQVVDMYGARWEWCGHLRRDSRGHPKPEVYGRGWARFVKTKGLRVGDELVFYRPPDRSPDHAAVVFVVSVKRSLRLMGQTFSGHLGP